MRRWTAYDYIFWTCDALLLLWILAKLFGFIQTPLIVEMFPLFTLCFMAGIFYKQVMGMNLNIRRVVDDIRDLDNETKASFHVLDKRVTALEIKNGYIRAFSPQPLNIPFHFLPPW